MTAKFLSLHIAKILISTHGNKDGGKIRIMMLTSKTTIELIVNFTDYNKKAR